MLNIMSDPLKPTTAPFQATGGRLDHRAAQRLGDRHPGRAHHGFVMLLYLPGHQTAATLAVAMTAQIPEIPEILRPSLAWDEGTEMAHGDHRSDRGHRSTSPTPPAMATRHHENTNGLLRQHFPKGTDLSFHGPGILDNVAAEPNARPRTATNGAPRRRTRPITLRPVHNVAAIA